MQSESQQSLFLQGLRMVTTTEEHVGDNEENQEEASNTDQEAETPQI
jgi:hypothetical protein